jgi:glycosyltransferase involved in cell wall biosynthesis
MRVLLVVSSLAPSYGGPAVSVPRLAGELAASGVQLSLWAPDGSAPRLAATAEAAGYAVLAGPLAAAAGQPLDLIHDNGLWWRHNHELAALAQRRRIPRLVSCRGMLLPWCLRHRGWRKCVAWHLYQRRDLRRAAALHVTCAAEAAAAAALLPEARCSLIPNGVDLPAAAVAGPLLPAPAARAGSDAGGVVLFLGRLCPVKGIDLLLQAWSHLQPSGWSLRIAGPDEGGWRRRLETLTLALGLRQSVRFLGPLDAGARQQQLLAADLLVLPSHSESFAMVVAEALAHGLPVLTTTATPWGQLAAIEAGWLCEPELASLTHGLGRALATPRATRRAMGARGRSHVAHQLSWRRTAEQFLGLYGSLLEPG